MKKKRKGRRRRGVLDGFLEKMFLKKWRGGSDEDRAVNLSGGGGRRVMPVVMDMQLCWRWWHRGLW